MIFSYTLVQWAAGEILNGNSFLIAIYKGNQPTAEEYIQNYSEMYGRQSPDLLQLVITNNLKYRGVQENSSSWGGVEKYIETNPDNLDYTQGLCSIREGEGTWAALFPGIGPATDVVEGWYEIAISFLPSTLNSNSGVIIVPISDLTDNGVVKFDSVNFSHPDEAAEDRALDFVLRASINKILLVFDRDSLPNGEVGAPYNQTITASGGIEPYTYEIISGSLPVGLTCNVLTGEITGAPEAEELATFTIKVTDSANNIKDKEFTISIVSGSGE